MKTITLQGTQEQMNNLFLKSLDFDTERLPIKVETRVYIVNQEDTTRKVMNLTDEKFIEIAEQWGRVYTLQSFQEIFNNNKDEISHSEDNIRFINVPLYE